MISYSKDGFNLNTQVVSPERAVAMQQAAELVGGIAISLLDPSIPEEADKFADAHTENERAGYNKDSRRQPRTPDDIKKEVVEYALQEGLLLVVLKHTQPDLGHFWRQAEQIAASNAATTE